MTKYEQVKQEIKSAILEGKFIPRQKISSEHELMSTFGVSRHTVRKAISELVNEGWLYTEQGAGTFCADRSNVHNKQEKTVAFLSTYISNYIFPSIISGAESYLSSKGYSILLYSTNNNIQKEKMCLEDILTRNISGLIAEPTKSNFYNPNLNYYLNLERNNTPYIMINAFYPELQPQSITVDDEAGGFLATEHLIKYGHKRIAGLFKTDDQQGVRRMQGFIRAHRENKLPILPGMMISFTTEDKYTISNKEEFKSLLQSKEKPTAIFCYNDEVAVDILDVIRDLNLNVPDDISIVGFDDSHLATATEVKLTTIKHPKNEMGKLAAETIVKLIEGKAEVPAAPKVYTPELVIRHSTKKV